LSSEEEDSAKDIAVETHEVVSEGPSALDEGSLVDEEEVDAAVAVPTVVVEEETTNN